MDVSVRKAKKSDVTEVHALLCELENREFDPGNFATVYYGNLACEDNMYLIAEVDGAVAGLLTCHGQTLLHHVGPVFEIQELIVKEKFRSLGIGKALLSRLEQELADIPHEILEVCSNVKRKRAHEFYLREGFAQSHYKFTKSV